MTAEQPSALAQAIEKIKQRAPDGLGRSIYPVTDKALCKQLRRDERTIQGAIELVKRMGIDPGARLALSRTYSAVNEYRKEASQEDLRKRLQKQPRREMTEEELLK